MLHTAGLSVQDIFFTLNEGTCENNYLKAKDALNIEDITWPRGDTNFIFEC